MSNINNIFDKIIPHLVKFANLKGVMAVKDGFILAMPFTFIGSMCLLLANMPIPLYTELMTNIFTDGYRDALYQVVGATFDMVALIGVFGVAYSYVKNEKIDDVTAGILGIVSMLIVTESSIMVDSSIIPNVIPKEYMGGKGMIASIIIGLSVGYIYTFFIKKDINIKMPEGVPQGIANAFTSIIPSMFIIGLSFVIYILFENIFNTTFIEKIYEVLQMPIQNITDSILGVILIPFLIGICWWCGIHGPTLVMGVMSPILTASALENQAIIDSGKQLIVGENANIFTIQLVDQFVTMGGSGITLGLVICMIMKAKSTHFKKLGKLSLFPGIFNINEPLLFGMPIVFNPLMLVPFVLIPTISSIITYICVLSGFIEPFSGIMLPWGIPPIISGFIVGGVNGAILQAVIIIISVFIYYPFMKVLDEESYNREKAI